MPMTLLSQLEEGQPNTKMHNSDEDFGDADIQWIKDTLEKQKKNNLISIHDLRKEMATFRKPMGTQRKQDTLGGTWHGTEKGLSRQPKSMQISTMQTMSKTASIPTMEELQTIMAAKQKYSKVKDVLGDHHPNEKFKLTETKPEAAPVEPGGQELLPTVEELRSLMLAARAGLKDKKNDSLRGSHHHSYSHRSYSLSPLRDPKDTPSPSDVKNDSLRGSQHRSRTHTRSCVSPLKLPGRVDKNQDPLRSSHHRRGHRLHIDREEATGEISQEADRRGDEINDMKEFVSPGRKGATRSSSRDRKHHDPLRSSSHHGRRSDFVLVDQTRQAIGQERNTKDSDNTEDRTGSLSSRPRNRSSSRGKRTAITCVSSGSEEDGESSCRKSRSASKERQRVASIDRLQKRRLLKGTKQVIMQEILSPSKQVDEKRQNVPENDFSEPEENDDCWMAFSNMSFEDDWDDVQTKSTQPLLDTEKALMVVAASQQTSEIARKRVKG